MTVKLDGTNGLLQNYDYQALTTGFSYTFAAGTQTLVINPAGTLATGTITMPAAPVDGMVVTFSSTKQITALTLKGNTGQTVVSGVSVLPANQATSYVYRLSNTSWYPMTTVATNVPVTGGGSAVTSGTAVASTSGTAIDFTGIPSWVKRITVMLNGVSTNGTNAFLVQLGTSSGMTTSGYTGSASGASASTINTAGSSASGLQLRNAIVAASAYSGAAIISLYGSNTWVSLSTLTEGGTSAFSSGIVTLPATLDRVRITTVNGTDTFDAGSINILYE